MLDLTHLHQIPDHAYWYLASPYSKYPDGLEAAFRDVCRATAHLITNSVKVYSPIAHTHPVAIHGDVDPLDHSIWLPADEPMMRAAHGLIVCKMETWEISYGIGVEIRLFQDMGRPIVYMDYPSWELAEAA
jgi:hypothetical protein